MKHIALSQLPKDVQDRLAKVLEGKKDEPLSLTSENTESQILSIALLQMVLVHFVVYRLNWHRYNFLFMFGIHNYLWFHWAKNNGSFNRLYVKQGGYCVQGFLVLSTVYTHGFSSLKVLYLLPLLVDAETFLTRIHGADGGAKVDKSGVGAMNGMWVWLLRAVEELASRVCVVVYASSILPVLSVPSSDLYYPGLLTLVLVGAFAINVSVLYAAKFIDRFQVKMRMALRLQGCWGLGMKEKDVPEGAKAVVPWDMNTIYCKGDHVVHDEKHYVSQYEETVAVPGSIGNLVGHFLFSDAAWSRLMLLLLQGMVVICISMSVYTSTYWVFYGIGLIGTGYTFVVTAYFTKPAEVMEQTLPSKT